MRIIIVGYGEMFRSVILGILKTQNEIVGVFRHDNILYNPLTKLYKDILSPSIDYNFIKTHKLPEIKANSVNSKTFLKQVKQLNADIVITASWSEKFSLRTIKSPNITCINVHPALLPKYRGPNPYMQTILHNEKETGITFHIMSEKYDSGKILHQAAIPIYNNDTGNTLKSRCCKTAQEEVQILLNHFNEKLENAKVQNEDAAVYYPNISLIDSVLDFNKETAVQIDSRIRAFTPWINCHIPYKNEFFTFKSHRISKEYSDKKPSTIIRKENKSIFIVCKDGSVIEFTDLYVKRPFSKLISDLYFEKFINVYEQAV